MRVVNTVADLRTALSEARLDGASIGFVPTMGFLHAGHASLMEVSVAANAVTVVSIYVNPLQFGAHEDLASYPTDRAGDLRTCEAAGVDLVFAPEAEEMHTADMSTTVAVGGVSSPLEGASRPSHFAGVATIVAKLFSIVGPCRAYFGAKDWQQTQVVARMTIDLSLPVEVFACPIIREPDGLAMSSRNIYLTTDERAQATVLRQALLVGVELVESGETDATRVESAMRDTINTASLAEIDYVAAVPAQTLVVDGPLDGDVRLLVAVRFGKARLIDNAGCRTIET